ncbi:MAG TPA: bile acid:sodium symporter [Candidatus Binatia bacterium]|nr:bile acid:sodium symporter [Candidatus Binatia bacterium]
MARLWRQYWFLLALAAVLTLGLATGLGAPTVATLYVELVPLSAATALVLFLMAFSLDSHRLRDSLRRPAGAVLGSVVNLGVLPILAAACARGLALPDLALGLILTGISPSTLATGSVFTRRAGGNDAISPLVTLLTNTACVVVTPLWLTLLVSRAAQMDTTAIVRQLAVCVLLPTVLGQLFLWPRIGRALADRHRARIGSVSQLIVLAIVSGAAVKAGIELQRHGAWPSAVDGAVMAGMCLLVHVAGLESGWYGGALLRLPPEDRIATAITGSQKSLPVSLLIATNPSVVTEDAPFVLFPLLAYHATQLLLDTIVADTWRRRRT